MPFVGVEPYTVDLVMMHCCEEEEDAETGT